MPGRRTVVPLLILFLVPAALYLSAVYYIGGLSQLERTISEFVCIVVFGFLQFPRRREGTWS